MRNNRDWPDLRRRLRQPQSSLRLSFLPSEGMLLSPQHSRSKHCIRQSIPASHFLLNSNEIRQIQLLVQFFKFVCVRLESINNLRSFRRKTRLFLSLEHRPLSVAKTCWKCPAWTPKTTQSRQDVNMSLWRCSRVSYGWQHYAHLYGLESECFETVKSFAVSLRSERIHDELNDTLLKHRTRCKMYEISIYITDSWFVKIQS